MERIFKHAREETKNIRVLIDYQEIRTYTVFSETVYEAIGKHMPINHLVNSIHVAQVQGEKDSYQEMIVYYQDCLGHNIAVTNDNIIHLLLSKDGSLESMPDGSIILWNEHTIVSTIDMQQFDFHAELKDLLKNHSIVFISERYILLRNNTLNKDDVGKFRTAVDLSAGKYPVKIRISNTKETC